MCSCMLIKKHEHADIGRSVIAKKMQIANATLYYYMVRCMAHLWTMYDPYVDHV